MSKFKIGDRVRCIDNTDYERRLTLNAVYTVKGFIKEQGSHNMQLVLLDEVDTKGNYPYRFELVVDEIKPKEKVKVIYRVPRLVEIK